MELPSGPRASPRFAETGGGAGQEFINLFAFGFAKTGDHVQLEIACRYLFSFRRLHPPDFGVAIRLKFPGPRMLARSPNATMTAGLQKRCGRDFPPSLGAVGALRRAVLTAPQFLGPEYVPAHRACERFPGLRIVSLEAGPGTVHAVALARARRNILSADGTLFHLDQSLGHTRPESRTNNALDLNIRYLL